MRRNAVDEDCGEDDEDADERTSCTEVIDGELLRHGKESDLSGAPGSSRQFLRDFLSANGNNDAAATAADKFAAWVDNLILQEISQVQEAAVAAAKEKADLAAQASADADGDETPEPDVEVKVRNLRLIPINCCL